MRILLVEDDEDLSAITRKGLQQAYLAVDCAGTVEQALHHLVETPYDVMCLDLGLPDGDGIELCRRIHDDRTLLRPHRILILTARDAVTDRVNGLDAGADDYLIKPFAFAELLARIRALLRRKDQSTERISVQDVEVDLVALRAYRAQRDLGLTGKEFCLLRYLASHPNKVVSSEELLEHCWDRNIDEWTSTVRVILSRLRRKLGDPPLIVTEPGQGYRLSDTL